MSDVIEEMRFVSSYPGFATVWEVREFIREGNDKSFALLNDQGYLILGSNGMWYHVECIFFPTTERAESYAGDNTLGDIVRVSVVHLTDSLVSYQHVTPRSLRFTVDSYLRGDLMGKPETYASLAALQADLISSAQPEYRIPVLNWARSAQHREEFTMMNGRITEVWLAHN